MKSKKLTKKKKEGFQILFGLVAVLAVMSFIFAMLKGDSISAAIMILLMSNCMLGIIVSHVWYRVDNLW